jgi:hypothetical protein
MRISTIIGGLLLIAIGLGTVWWFKNFDHVSEKVYQGLKGDAAEDPYFAMKRFLASMHVQVEERLPSSTGNAKLSGWPAHGTVMLGDRRHLVMTPARVAQALAWVQGGGHLIIEAEYPGRPDPLLAAIGIERRPLAARAPRGRPVQSWDERNLTAVAIPGYPRVLQVQFSPYQNLADPRHLALWKVENAQGLRMVHLARGAGMITIVSNFDWLVYQGTRGAKEERRQPTNIGKFDHAELLMALVRLNPRYAQAPLRLIWGDDEVSIWSSIAGEAWMALAALAALLLLWLARVIPRFGPLRPEPPPAEQRLAAHLEASGRFFWKYLEPHVVFGKLRDAFAKRLAERRPALSAMRPEQRNAELARLIDGRGEAVARALDQPTQTAPEFVRNVRLLQRLLEKL